MLSVCPVSSFMKSISISLLLCLSTTAYSFDFTPEAVPENLYILDSSGNVYVDHVATGCSGNTYYLRKGHIMFDQMFALLLAAQTSKQKVILRFESCTGGSHGIIDGIKLK